MIPPDDLNWQMSLLFVLAIALLGFVMKLVALLLPGARTKTDWRFVLSPLPAPGSMRRAQPLANASRLVLPTLGLAALLVAAYWVYWKLVRTFEIHGIILSYLAAPFLLLMGYLLAPLVSPFWLPSGRLLPPVHNHPPLMRSVGDFWGRRWNLWFSDWFRLAIFNRGRQRPVLALILVFALSGLMHEWVINVPLWFVTGRFLFGTMMLYFLLQAVGILVERRFLKGRARWRIAFAWLVVFVPAPLMINEGLLRALHLWPG